MIYLKLWLWRCRMIKIAICDDDKFEKESLEEIIKLYIDDNINQWNIEYNSYGNGVDLLSDIGNGERFDIIILDIIMPMENGIEIAKEIRSFDRIAKIIFLTSSPGFAIDSYSVGAFYYLLKPPVKDDLFEILNRAILEINDISEEIILVNAKDGLSKINLFNIEFVEVIGRNLIYNLKGGKTVEEKGTIGDLEKKLLKYNFFIKPHRSYVLNMNSINILNNKEIITVSGVGIPISRKKYTEIKKAFIEYSFKKGE